MTVEIAFDVYPGKVFKGTIREMSYGVAVDTAPLGSLSTIQNQRSWLREAQRFPVLIDFSLPADVPGSRRSSTKKDLIFYLFPIT
jgi:multidrug resistance efflux pump